MPAFRRVQEIAHEIGPTGRFSLRVTSFDVELRPSADDTARVRIEFDIRATGEAEADATFDRARFRVDAGDGVLEVAEPRREDGGIGSIVRLLGVGSRVDARLVCDVPSAARVAFAGVSTDLVVHGMVGAQDYRTVSGDAVLGEVAGSLRIATVSGDVSLRGADAIDLHANTVSGDLSAFAPRFDGSRVTTVSGDVELEGELADGGDHRFETVSGDLSLGTVGGMRLEVRGLSTDVSISLPHRSEGSRDRRRYVIGDAGPQVIFSSMSGDVTVRASRRYDARRPAPPTPPMPPTTPTAPVAPAAANSAGSISADEQLAVLRALEAGEIDVEEASRRLAGEHTGG